MSSYSGYFILKDTISSVKKIHKCSTLLKVDDLQIIQQVQPIYIIYGLSGPTAPIESIGIVPPNPHISSYITKSDLDKSFQQSSDLISILYQYTFQLSPSIAQIGRGVV